MFLEYKPDYDDALRHWEAFWANDIIDRPCIKIIAPKDGVDPAPAWPGLLHPDRNPVDAARAFDRWAQTIYFGGDTIPQFWPNFGPDIFAGFLGAEIEFAFEVGTSWAKPFVTDWKEAIKTIAQPHGPWWEFMLGYLAEARKIAEGKFAIGVLDLHGGMDCLAAIRGQQELCFDLADVPDEIDEAMKTVRPLYQTVFDGLRKASGQDVTGCTSWIPMYTTGMFAPIQCDFICMISPEHFRRFVRPALEEESSFLDHCCYHYDGPDALRHLDDILSIKGIDAIQWVPGAGAPPVIEWMDLLKKMQAAGKSLYIGASVEEVKVFHKELRPELVFYDVWASSESEANGLLDWLRANT